MYAFMNICKVTTKQKREELLLEHIVINLRCMMSTGLQMKQSNVQHLGKDFVVVQ